MEAKLIEKLKRMLRQLDDYQLANEYAELLTTHAEEFSRAARYLSGGATFTAEWFRGRITTGWESVCIYREEIDRRRAERGL